MPYRQSIYCIVLVICLLIAGCGYRLAGQIPVRGDSVAISGFSNKTLRPNLDSCLAAKLAAAFSATGMVVSPLETADLEISGSILAYSESVSSYNALDKVATYQSAMTAEAKLRHLKRGDTLWQGVVKGGQDYPTNSDIALKLNAQEAALHELCRKLAEDIVRQIGNSF